MAQTRDGRIKQLCNRRNIRFEHYQQMVAQGFKWCTGCKSFVHCDLFGSDHTRYDGKKAKCVTCCRVKVPMNTSGRASAFKGRKHTEASRVLMRKANAGPNNPNWKGGITSLIQQIRNTDQYKQWRYAVYLKNNFTCQACDVKKVGRNIILDADHITALSELIVRHSVTSVEQALLTPELWDVGNGRCLCRPCHKETDTWGVNARRN
jgi:hypothetical protein